jgi:[protein-PII] uridylyltransferase
MRNDLRAAPAAGVDVAAAAAAWRERLKTGRAALREAFLARPDTNRLLREHSRLVSSTLVDIWQVLRAPKEMTLLAVGGYGRGHLYPHSDVDLLILLPREADAADTAFVGTFIGMLWDVGIEPGYSARTIADCENEMAGDITVQTSMLENRHLAGSRTLWHAFQRAFTARLDVAHFYEAKALEQQQRHLKYHDAAYNLEPNLKESPGGLRDLQSVLWIARAAGLGRSWIELAKAGLMTTQEARSVARQELMLSTLRVRLHYLAGRREDRLVFDQQTALARDLGFTDTAHKRASEQLMQRYYRAAKLVRQANVILLQNLHARLLPIASERRPLSDEFVAIDWLLHIQDETLFERRPAAMLDAVLMMQRHPDLTGM